MEKAGRDGKAIANRGGWKPGREYGFPAIAPEQQAEVLRMHEVQRDG